MANVILLCIIAFCTVLPFSQSADNLQELLFNGDYEFIDLTHRYCYEGNTHKPGRKDQAIKKYGEVKGTYGKKLGKKLWYAKKDSNSNEHAVTHLHVPYNFTKLGKVADIPLDWLIVPMIIVDVSSKVEGDPNYVLYKKDLDTDLHTRLDQRFQYLLIFKFGWSQYVCKEKYLGVKGKKKHHPGISVEVAEWIISMKNIVGVGVDTPTVDSGSHIKLSDRMLSKNGLYVVENVNLHRHINVYNCTALVLSNKIERRSTPSARLVAVCPKPKAITTL